MDVSEQVSALRSQMRGGRFEANCPSRVVLDHVTSKWGVLALCTLAGRTMRFGELRRSVEGISEKMLAQTLQTLEKDGLVRREAKPVIPPHVEYSLTPLGQDLVSQHLWPLMGWLLRESPAIVDGTARATAEAADVVPAPA